MVTSLSIWLIVCPHLKHSYHVHRFNGILLFIFLTGAVHKSMSQPEPSHRLIYHMHSSASQTWHGSRGVTINNLHLAYL